MEKLMVTADFLVKFGTVFRQEVRAQQAECAADATYFGIFGQAWRGRAGS